MEIIKNIKGKVSFGDLIKKSEEENLPLIEIVENYNKKARVSVAQKIVTKSLMLLNFVNREALIQSLEASEITEDNVSVINEQINKLRIEQEIDIIFSSLNLFLKDIEFTSLDQAQYDTLFQLDIFDYFDAILGKEFELFLQSFNRDASVGLNKASADALIEMSKELTQSLDLGVLNGVKNELQEISKSESFARVSEVVEKLGVK